MNPHEYFMQTYTALSKIKFTEGLGTILWWQYQNRQMTPFLMKYILTWFLYLKLFHFLSTEIYFLLHSIYPKIKGKQFFHSVGIITGQS